MTGAPGPGLIRVLSPMTSGSSGTGSRCWWRSSTTWRWSGTAADGVEAVRLARGRRPMSS